MQTETYGKPETGASVHKKRKNPPTAQQNGPVDNDRAAWIKPRDCT
jgi:hypothetical protein